MHMIVIVVHMFVSIGLIGLVLIQHGKGADAGAAFGSGASSTVFGSRGSASFLTRTTAILATTFFITSLTLGYFSNPKEEKSVVEKVQPVTEIKTESPVEVNQKSSELPPESISITETPPVPPVEKAPVVDDSSTKVPENKAPAENTAPTSVEEVPAKESK